MASFSIIKTLLEKAESKTFKKGEILLRKGELIDFIFYVEKGCLRSYILDVNAKEHIYQFASEDHFISDEDAVMNHTPSILYIDAIEDSTIKLIKRSYKSDADDEATREINELLERKIGVLRKRILQLL